MNMSHKVCNKFSYILRVKLTIRGNKNDKNLPPQKNQSIALNCPQDCIKSNAVSTIFVLKKTMIAICVAMSTEVGLLGVTLCISEEVPYYCLTDSLNYHCIIVLYCIVLYCIIVLLSDRLFELFLYYYIVLYYCIIV